MSVLSSPSSHSIQCSAFACCIFSAYQFHCFRCSLWMGWFGFARWCFALPANCCICFLSSVSSSDHHRFEYRLGFDSSTFLLMASCIASFSALSFLSKLWMLSISVGGGRLARLVFSIFTSYVQSAHLKLGLGVILILGMQMSIHVTMGQWSIFTGRDSSSVLHLTIAFSRPALQKTLSTLVWFPVLWACSVGVYAGRAIFILCLPNMLSRGCVSSRFSHMKRCVFWASSHRGW